MSFSPSANFVNVPSSGSVQFSIAVRLAANAGTQDIRGYSIPVDLSPPLGTDPPPGISVVAVSQVLDFPDLPFQFSLNPQEGDLFAQDGNLVNAISFTTTPVTLFNFTVAVDSTAIAGDYLASFVNGSLLSINDGLGARIPNNQMVLETASIRIQAVPEPSSFAMTALAVGLFGIGLGSRYRRKTELVGHFIPKTSESGPNC